MKGYLLGNKIDIATAFRDQTEISRIEIQEQAMRETYEREKMERGRVF
ncbi:MAG: hypothetical protein ACRD8Z_25150 [Nitrososphaeraceae archaeon]